MLLKSIPFGFTLFLSAFCIAQQQVGKNIADHLLIKSADKDRYGETDKETVGSPYLKDDFVKGKVYTFNRDFNDVPMRYNIYNDYVEFTQDNKTYILDPEPRIKELNFDNKTFLVFKYEYKGKSKHGYLELLDTGKVMLLAKKTMLYREWQPAKALESGPTPAKYTKTGDIYFYKIGDGEVTRVEGLKTMIESFPDKQTELTAFAKKEKLGAKDAEDLKKLLKYYNSL